jgi:arylsulfatase A-like enzyme
MRRSIWLSGVLVLCFFTAAQAAQKPNIVLIVLDDLGYADIGAQNISKDVKTPNIDTIAANGVRFTNGYVSCPVCSPTRAGLMTGRYQQRFGHEFNPGTPPAEGFGLPLDQVTLPQVLKGAGYRTGMVGKWHLGMRDGYLPTERGFDEYFGFLHGGHSYTKIGEGRAAVMRGTEPVTQVGYLTDTFSREASEFVKRNHEQPFFLYLAFNAVHTPQEAPEKYLSRFPNVTDEKRKLMLAMLSAADDGVGQVLAQLREHKLEENTLVILHTDNGGPTQGNGSVNTPLSGFKGQVWEGGIRVPFMAQWKGKIPAGKVIDQPVIALDVFPTACVAAGADLPKEHKIDGIDLMPLMCGKSGAPVHDALYWRYGRQAAVRSGNFKLVKLDGEPDKLFDLYSDSGEKNDLRKEKPDVLKKLQTKFDQWNGGLKKPLWGDQRMARRAETDSQQQQRPRNRQRARAKRQESPATQSAD